MPEQIIDAASPAKRSSRWRNLTIAYFAFVLALVGALVWALAFLPDRTIDTTARDSQVRSCTGGNVLRQNVRWLNQLAAAWGLPPSNKEQVWEAWVNVVRFAQDPPAGVASRDCQSLFDE